VKPICNEIISQYDLVIRKYQYLRSSYYLDTNNGRYLLRKAKVKKEQLEFEYEVNRHLLQSNFENISRIYLTKKNTPYAIYQDQLYVMQEYDGCEETDFKDSIDLNNIVLVLGKFHKAATHFHTNIRDVETVNIKNMYTHYKKRASQNNHLKKIIARSKHKTNFEIMYLKDFGFYEKLQELALMQSSQEAYENLIEQTRESKKVAHNEYAYHAVSKTKGQGYVINNLDTCNYGVQLLDLVHILGRIMQKNNWNIELLYELIDTYNSINTITGDALSILKMLLIFPGKYDSICFKYMTTKRRWNYNMFEQKWKNMVDYQRMQEEAARQIARW
jgi:CotS family spore coat protein